MYNCKWTEIVLALIILVFSFVDWYSKWIIVIAAILLLIRALMCKSCDSCMDKGKKSVKKKKK